MALNHAQKTALSRRSFVGGAAAVGLFSIVPSHVLAARARRAPSEKINIACIGTGGRGKAQWEGCAGENIVALCDVDTSHGQEAKQRFPNARVYQDWRRMFDEMGDQIDAVTVSTPDHTHAVAVMAAIKRGKHVYCEKPLAHSIWEVRQLMAAARTSKVITQLGNQGHSFDTIRSFCEWIWDDAIGKVHTIHAGCNSVYSRIDLLPKLNESHPVPDTLNWDLWLGPVPYRPYHPMYHPNKWRGWMPFGTGVIGDWVCHIVDPVFWALDLGAPTSIQAQAKNYDPKIHGLTFPAGSVIKYEFPAKGKRGPVTMYWRDGEEKLPRPAELDQNRRVPGMGAVVLGDKGGITYGSHGASGVRLFPEEKMKAYQARMSPQTLPRIKGRHHKDWLDAIRANKPAGSNFDYGGPLVEIALLGVIATRLLGQELKWDGQKGQFTNSSEANAMIRPIYREGWSL